MLPEQNITYTDDIEVSNMPSRTWRINSERGRVEEVIDGKEAVAQTIDMILDTARYTEVVLPDWYGHEFLSLVGEELFLIESEAPRMIKEALLVDDRIIGIKDFNIIEGEEIDEAVIRFTAETIFGDVEVERILER